MNELWITLKQIAHFLEVPFGLAMIVGIGIFLIVMYLTLRTRKKESLPTIDDVVIIFQCPDCSKHTELTVSYLVRVGIERPINCNCTDGNSSFKVVETYIR